MWCQIRSICNQRWITWLDRPRNHKKHANKYQLNVKKKGLPLCGTSPQIPGFLQAFIGLLWVNLGFFMCHIYWTKVCQLSVSYTKPQNWTRVVLCGKWQFESAGEISIRIYARSLWHLAFFKLLLKISGGSMRRIQTKDPSATSAAVAGQSHANYVRSYVVDNSEMLSSAPSPSSSLWHTHMHTLR